MPDSASTSLPPYSLIGLVILLSLGLTGYELFKIFGRDFGPALRHTHALWLGLLNVGAAVGIWFIIHHLLAFPPSLLSALVTGLTFPALLRSRFTFYRSLHPPEPDEPEELPLKMVDELSLKMDEIYQSLQQALYDEVDLKIAARRQALNQRIRDAFSQEQLADYLAELIEARRLTVERHKNQQRLQKILALPQPDERHRQLAYLLLSLKTAAEIEAAIRAKSLAPRGKK